MIEFKDVTKVYEGTVALNQLNLTLQSGEIVGLIGHNGAGKSTTIKSLVSVINPSRVRFLWMGKNYPLIAWKSRKKSAM